VPLVPETSNAARTRGGTAVSYRDASGHRVCTTTAPAATSALWQLLALLGRPLPLGQLRPAALAAGLTQAQVETAIGIATRRGELIVTADRDGTVLAIAGRWA
jgi:hypothetical protein